MVVKNQLLTYQSKELTRLKVKSYISPRSIFLIDSAVYSDFFGYLDSIILEMPVSIVDIHSFEQNRNVVLAKGAFQEVNNYTLNNGEDIILKTISSHMKFSNNKKIIVLSVEARIASLLPNHPNIVNYHGLLSLNNTSFLVQSRESNYLLKDFFMQQKSSDPWVFSSILRGICNAITFMHKKGVLNNNIRHDNIALWHTSMNYSPVILSLSLACRADSSKQLTITQQVRYEGLIRLPPRVLKGFEAPSYASDRYSMAFIIGNIIQSLQKMKIPINECLNKIWRKCFVWTNF